MKFETNHAIQGKNKTCIDVDTQIKFNNCLSILEEILWCQRFPEEKKVIGYTKVSDDVCDKGELGSNKWVTFHKRYEQHKKPMYANSSM